MNDATYPFLGTGWAFPPAFDHDAGTVNLVSGVKDIEESLNILLSTTLGERVMQPKYGCNLNEYVFDPLDNAVIGYLKDRVQNSILFYEPRINVENITVTPAGSDELLEGRFTIAVEYSIPNTNSRFNYVYDYYLNEAAQPI
ncbi:MAG: GPW/gp25 family protein [Bacteroidetes bacterium]|nr:GPW/gp25 family protein [Bacteroidota bacterium]